MSERHAFDEKEPFLAKLKQLLADGVATDRLTIYTPYHVHETDHLLEVKPSRLGYFTAFGAISGLTAGLLLTIGTVLDWPLITGGKPLISFPPFLIIVFELTILIGAVVSFLGFLFLARFPSPKGILDPVEHDNRFIVVVAEAEGQ